MLNLIIKFAVTQVCSVVKQDSDSVVVYSLWDKCADIGPEDLVDTICGSVGENVWLQPIVEYEAYPYIVL